MIVGCIQGIAAIGYRSHLSKIVDRDEIGKVMTIMQAVETTAPLVGTTVFAYCFNYTMDNYPGCCYQLIAALMLIPIYAMIWIDLFTDRPQVDGVIDKTNKLDGNTSNE